MPGTQDTYCFVFIVLAILYIMNRNNEQNVPLGSSYALQCNCEEGQCTCYETNVQGMRGSRHGRKSRFDTSDIKNAVNKASNKVSGLKRAAVKKMTSSAMRNHPNSRSNFKKNGRRSNFNPYSKGLPGVNIKDTGKYENHVNYGATYEISDYNPGLDDLTSTEYTDNVIKDISLESEVARSHKDYVDNISHVSTGASVHTLLDDSSRSVETMNFVGLSGRKTIKALRHAKPGEGMREIHGFDETSLDEYRPDDMNSLI